jgi:hypothetical protein
MKKFIPFAEISSHPHVLGVDCYHPKAFCLSHWRGANNHADLEGDTSTEIAINAVNKNIPELAYPVVTNNHFDIDGFIGVWCVMHPETVHEFEAVFRQMALIGDFREYNPNLPEADFALKLVCWINTKEKELFYAPFGAQFTEQKEAELCVEKYEWFLANFGNILNHPFDYLTDWQEEYNHVKAEYKLIQEEGKRTANEEIRLSIVHASKPVHYYALYAHSENADMVMSIYPGQRYELEYKYTTWIDTATRKSFPRIQPEGLVALINKEETSGFTWQAQKFTDTAPLISLNSNSFTKEQRYDHPFTRQIESSSISEEHFIRIVTDFYHEHLKSAPKQSRYTWEEMRAFNQNLFY